LVFFLFATDGGMENAIQAVHISIAEITVADLAEQSILLPLAMRCQAMREASRQ
jgi:hypothetical protein